jgi:hypothetical protein
LAAGGGALGFESSDEQRQQVDVGELPLEDREFRFVQGTGIQSAGDGVDIGLQDRSMDHGRDEHDGFAVLNLGAVQVV